MDLFFSSFSERDLANQKLNIMKKTINTFLKKLPEQLEEDGDKELAQSAQELINQAQTIFEELESKPKISDAALQTALTNVSVIEKRLITFQPYLSM